MNDLSPELNHAVETGPPEAEAGAVLTIDLGALVANWRLLQARAGGAECAAVVKADGYGLGHRARWCGRSASRLPKLLRRRTCPRRWPPGRHAADGTIHVLNGLLPGTAGTFASLGLTPILGSQDEIAEWAGFCRSAGARYPAALHFDTGMNRLGLPAAAAAEIARSPLLADFEPALVMSHFVSSEEPENPLNARQVDRFAARTASLSESAGVALQLVRRLPAARAALRSRPSRATPSTAAIRLPAAATRCKR